MLMGSAQRCFDPRDPVADENVEDLEDLEDLELEDEGEEPEDEIEGDEPVDEADPDEEPEPQRQPTRGENRVAAATRAAKEARDDAAAVRRELEQERAARNNTSAADAKRQRDEYVATLTGDQRTEFLLREQHQSTERQLQQIRFESYDASDRAAFESLAAQKPAIRAIAAKVEEELGRIRAGGGNVSREVVAKYVLGDMAMAKATRANNAGAKRAQAGRERQAVRPSNGRGDVAADRSRKGSKLEDRLRDVKL